MDVYLPADFREIHDAAPDDWRDVSSTSSARDRSGDCERHDANDSPNACADPNWRVF